MNEFFTRTDARIDIGTDDTVDLQVDAPRRMNDGASLVDADLTGRVLGNRYHLVESLGRGGMGHVYKALDWSRASLPEARQFVALKVLRRDIAGRSRLLSSLRREFYCAQALSHPHIVRVFETAQDGALAFFTMELLEGVPLSSMLAKRKPQALLREQAWSIIRAVGGAIVHAHSRQVVHGDIKPQNIMITHDSGVRVLDFGTAGTSTQSVAAGDSMQRDGAPAVTLAYCCCEMIDGQQTDARDDLFSLGCVAYELLCGVHPFAGLSASEAKRRGLSPARIANLTSPQWRALQQALAWHREDRNISVEQWLESLLPSSNRVQHERAAESSAASLLWRQTAVRRAALAAGATAVVVALLAYSSSISIDSHQARSAPAPQPTLQSSPQALTESSVTPPEPLASRSALPMRIIKPRVILSASSLTVPAGERFAEIYVERSGLENNTRFVWWTEGSTAKPNEDFVAQGRANQSFSPGRRTTRVFVRLVPNVARTRTKRFYVAVAEPTGVVVARALVSIPPAAAPMVASN